MSFFSKRSRRKEGTSDRRGHRLKDASRALCSVQDKRRLVRTEETAVQCGLERQRVSEPLLCLYNTHPLHNIHLWASREVTHGNEGKSIPDAFKRVNLSGTQ